MPEINTYSTLQISSLETDKSESENNQTFEIDPNFREMNNPAPKPDTHNSYEILVIIMAMTIFSAVVKKLLG